MVPFRVCLGALMMLLGFTGCKEEVRVLERRVVADRYIIEELVRDEVTQEREIDIRFIGKKGERPVSRLFLHRDRVITLSPTPGVNDAFHEGGRYRAVCCGEQKTAELFLHGNLLMTGSPPGHGPGHSQESVETTVHDFLERFPHDREKVVHLTIGQATPYDSFLEVFEPLVNVGFNIGLGHFAVFE